MHACYNVNRVSGVNEFTFHEGHLGIFNDTVKA